MRKKYISVGRNMRETELCEKVEELMALSVQVRQVKSIRKFHAVYVFVSRTGKNIMDGVKTRERVREKILRLTFSDISSAPCH